MSVQTKMESAEPYFQGAASLSLDALKTFSGLIPVPYVGIATDAACRIIEIAEVGQIAQLLGERCLRSFVRL